MVLKWNNQKKDKDWFLPVLIFYQKLPLFPKLSLFYTKYIKSFLLCNLHKKYVKILEPNFSKITVFFDINKRCRIFLVFCGGVYEEKRV